MGEFVGVGDTGPSRTRSFFEVPPEGVVSQPVVLLALSFEEEVLLLDTIYVLLVGPLKFLKLLLGSIVVFILLDPSFNGFVFDFEINYFLLPDLNSLEQSLLFDPVNL